MLEHYTGDLPLTSHTSHHPIPRRRSFQQAQPAQWSPTSSPTSSPILPSHMYTALLASTLLRLLIASVPSTRLSQPYFGLPRPTYRKLLISVTHILHNAWEVNFNHSIQSVQYLHIHAVRRFINFSSHSKYGAFIFFISTIGTAKSYPFSHTGPMPKSITDECSLPQAMGYAESKHVAESMVDEAARVSGMRSVVCSVGLVAGPT